MVYIMSLEKIRELYTIIERDSTDTTYKYALLRSVSEICQHYTHFMKKENGRVWFPLGLLIEKWLFYYYPIIAHPTFIPQKPSEQDLDKPGYKISFRKQFNKITSYYDERGGFSDFYNDYRKGRVPQGINDELLDLVKRLRDTIIRYPMKHLGYSVTKEHYSFFDFTKGERMKRQPVNPDLVLRKFGEFSISEEYFEIFNLIGGFISGEYSILNKWAEFTVKSDKTRKITQEEMLEVLTTQPITEREVNDARKFFESLIKKHGYLECIWSGKKLKSMSELHIDHIIPFSVWRNNDLWNLLPTHRDINLKKRDRIPSQELLLRRKTLILRYWGEIKSLFPDRFDSEIRLSLTGISGENDDLLNVAFGKLVDKVLNLITQYGYLEWSIQRGQS